MQEPGYCVSALKKCGGHAPAFHWPRILFIVIRHDMVRCLSALQFCDTIYLIKRFRHYNANPLSMPFADCSSGCHRLNLPGHLAMM
jgi:hypothetical protein